MNNSDASSRTTTIRLAIGLVQGLALYFLYSSTAHFAWPNTWPTLFTCVVVITALTPTLIIAGLGHFSNKQLSSWAITIISILTLLVVYDHWRVSDTPTYVNDLKLYISPLLCFFILVGFFIAHSLAHAGAQEKRYIASYPTYFESAWKLCIQLQFSLLFVLAIWLTLWLGVALFALLKLHFLKDLIREPYFFIPFTTINCAYAIHLTDVKPAIIREIRNLLLTLHSWVLPLAVLIIGTFLLALPITGLTTLWETRHAGAILLTAAATLIILINTAYQNGLATNELANIIRWSARIACLLLLPLTLIAAYALSLRVGDYGWTNDRITAACCIFIAAFYAVGYLWAACQKDTWLGKIASCNISTAFLTLAILLALFSPLLDPARISVASQINRLNTGKEKPEKFDYNYLRFDSARFGQAALNTLATTTEGPNATIIQAKAQLALTRKNKWDENAKEKLTTFQIKENLSSWPADKIIPESFLNTSWKNNKTNSLPSCLSTPKVQCHVYLFDYDGDNVDEILLIPTTYDDSQLFKWQQKKWIPIATLGYLNNCTHIVESMKNGEIHAVNAEMNDIQIGDMRIQVKKIKPEQQPCKQ